MERMAELAKQQGGLGQQAAGMLPLAGSAGIQQELRRLANRQRALAEELQRMQGQGNMPGAGELADEAKELARRLDAGRLDRQVVERQERLFRRMLDAGRTLQGKEEDEQKERESTTAADDTVRLPPALRAKLTADDGWLRVPTWDELQRLSPEERRLVVDYFRRLSESPAR
jgi:signal transduction histidine kinase